MAISFQNQQMLFVLVFLALILKSAICLECYKCNGCGENVKTTKETCKDFNPNTEKALCVNQIVRHTRSNENMVVKKCEIVDKNVVFQCQNLPDTIPLSCSHCNTDFCNSATDKNKSILLSATALILLLKLFF